MTIERALEIIAAYGADAARWPDDERAGVLALVADPAVAKALAQASDLDTVLAGWALDVAPAAFDAAMLVPAVRPVRRWFAGGALAAAVAAVVFMGPLLRDGTSAPAVSSMVTASVIPTVPSATVEAEDAETFGYVFTPTADEDQLI